MKTYLHVLWSDHDMEVYCSIVAKHLIGPSPDTAYEFDCSNAIVSNQDSIDNPLASKSMDKLTRCGHLHQMAYNSMSERPNNSVCETHTMHGGIYHCHSTIAHNVYSNTR